MKTIAIYEYKEDVKPILVIATNCIIVRIIIKYIFLCCHFVAILFLII